LEYAAEFPPHKRTEITSGNINSPQEVGLLRRRATADGFEPDAHSSANDTSMTRHSASQSFLYGILESSV
jgi:hypothetical protein